MLFVAWPTCDNLYCINRFICLTNYAKWYAKRSWEILSKRYLYVDPPKVKSSTELYRLNVFSRLVISSASLKAFGNLILGYLISIFLFANEIPKGLLVRFVYCKWKVKRIPLGRWKDRLLIYHPALWAWS